jgi:hypothetical protein
MLKSKPFQCRQSRNMMIYSKLVLILRTRRRSCPYRGFKRDAMKVNLTMTNLARKLSSKEILGMDPTHDCCILGSKLLRRDQLLQVDMRALSAVSRRSFSLARNRSMERSGIVMVVVRADVTRTDTGAELWSSGRNSKSMIPPDKYPFKQYLVAGTLYGK